MILIFSVLIILVFLISIAEPNSILNNKFTSQALLIFIVIFTSVAIFFIDKNTITDAYLYTAWFESFNGVPLSQTNIFENREPLFFLLQWTVSQLTSSFDVLLVVVWLIISINIIKSLKNTFSKTEILIVFFSYMTYFIFFDYVLNAIRQGIAVSFLMLAISVLIHNRKKRIAFYLSILIAPLFHITSLPLSLGLLALRFFRFRLRTILTFWILSALLFVTDLNSYIGNLGFLQNVSFMDDYTSNAFISSYGSSVNRLDFLLFSAFWALFGLISWSKLLNKDESYKHILKIYLFFNTYYLLFGFIAYSDRIASYSWFLVPILVWKTIFPLKNKQLKTVATLIVFLVIEIASGSFSLLF